MRARATYAGLIPGNASECYERRRGGGRGDRGGVRGAVRCCAIYLPHDTWKIRVLEKTRTEVATTDEMSRVGGEARRIAGAAWCGTVLPHVLEAERVNA